MVFDWSISPAFGPEVSPGIRTIPSVSYLQPGIPCLIELILGLPLQSLALLHGSVPLFRVHPLWILRGGSQGGEGSWHVPNTQIWHIPTSQYPAPVPKQAKQAELK